MMILHTYKEYDDASCMIDSDSHCYTNESYNNSYRTLGTMIRSEGAPSPQGPGVLLLLPPHRDTPSNVGSETGLKQV